MIVVTCDGVDDVDDDHMGGGHHRALVSTKEWQPGGT